MKTENKIVILTRHAFPEPHWEKFGTAHSLEEAHKIWEKKIKGKGITGWTEFKSEAEAEEMLKPK